MTRYPLPLLQPVQVPSQQIALLLRFNQAVPLGLEGVDGLGPELRIRGAQQWANLGGELSTFEPAEGTYNLTLDGPIGVG